MSTPFITDKDRLDALQKAKCSVQFNDRHEKWTVQLPGQVVGKIGSGITIREAIDDALAAHNPCPQCGGKKWILVGHGEDREHDCALVEPPITDDEWLWLHTGLVRMPDGSLR